MHRAFKDNCLDSRLLERIMSEEKPNQREVLKISMEKVRVAVYRLLREGIIRTIRVGKKYIIPKQSIIDFISTGESFFRKG